MGVRLLHGLGLGIEVRVQGKGLRLAGLVVIEIYLAVPGLVALYDGRGLLKGPGGLVIAVHVGDKGHQPAVAEQAVIGPVRKGRTDRYPPAAHGYGVHQEHHHHEDRQGQHPVCHHTVYLVGDGQAVLSSLFLYRLVHNGVDVAVPLIGYNALRVVVQFLLTLGDVLLQVGFKLIAYVQLLKNLLVPFE